MQGAEVLVVDDDLEIRSLVSEVLQEEGYRPLPFGSGREVLEHLQEGNGQPDAMILDLMMPDVDGHQVLDQLREWKEKVFPVLIVSAQRPDSSILRALDSELRDFIAKPFELEELLIRLQRLLRNVAGAEAATGKGCLRVYALGSLRVYLDDVPLFDESWRNKPAKTIFKLLFTNRGKRYPKDVLAEELWPETDPDVASNRLRVAVHELRKILGDKGRKDKGQSYISQQEGTYYFDPRAFCWSDADAFEDAVNRGKTLAVAGDIDGAIEAYVQAESLYLGDYLRDDPYMEWSVATRERLREAHLAMLGDAARLHAEAGLPSEAAAYCRKILRVEPWREEVYRHLMEYLVAAGRPNEALRAFEECRRALRAEVEAEPSAETVRLRNSIAGGTWAAAAGGQS